MGFQFITDAIGAGDAGFDLPAQAETFEVSTRLCVLPVMYVNGVGGGEESTILGGVVSFWRSGSWDIAALIFTASVAVPATKFLALALLLWTVHRRSSWAFRRPSRGG